MKQVSPRAQDRFVAKLMRTKQRTKVSKRKRTNYARGAEVERRIVNAARARGCIAARTAGSHSPIDVFVIDNENETITFIQSKRSKTKRFPKVVAPFREGYYLVRFQQVNHQDGKPMVFPVSIVGTISGDNQTIEYRQCKAGYLGNVNPLGSEPDVP